MPSLLSKVQRGRPVTLERVPKGERRGEDAERQVREGQRSDERVPRVHSQLPVVERYEFIFSHRFRGQLYDLVTEA